MTKSIEWSGKKEEQIKEKKELQWEEKVTHNKREDKKETENEVENSQVCQMQSSKWKSQESTKI